MVELKKLRPATLWAAPAGSGWGPLPEMLLIMTLVTGLVDSVSILALGRVFGADPSTGHRGHVTLIRRLLAVLTMLCGALLGAWLVLHTGAVAPLGLVTALLAASAAWSFVAARTPGDWRQAAPAAAPAAQPPAR